MMAVVGCILQQHNLWLVLMAAVICCSGSSAMVRLFLRAADARSTERFAWIVLSAFVTGASIWCTHFVAMLGSVIGLLVATGKHAIAQFVGLAVVVMH